MLCSSGALPIHDHLFTQVVCSVISCIVFFFFICFCIMFLILCQRHTNMRVLQSKFPLRLFLNFTGYVGLASSAGNSYCNGYTDREESENKKRRNKWGGSSLPKIEECGQRPSPLWTSDRTQGPLGVFIRLIVISPVP